MALLVVMIAVHTACITAAPCGAVFYLAALLVRCVTCCALHGRCRITAPPIRNSNGKQHILGNGNACLASRCDVFTTLWYPVHRRHTASVRICLHVFALGPGTEHWHHVDWAVWVLVHLPDKLFACWGCCGCLPGPVVACTHPSRSLACNPLCKGLCPTVQVCKHLLLLE